MDTEERNVRLPMGVPVNTALLRSIAAELQRALRRRGLAVGFSAVSLFEVMNDLALAVLNRESAQPITQPRADVTYRKLKEPWFDQVVGAST
jgi:hypothetical protein